MGIPGLLKEIGKGQRIALSKLAIDHLEHHQRPLRIAIDAAIWNYQTQHGGQGGKNPALRTLFYRLLRLLALPIHPVFVYDGKNKPLTKRGKTVSRYGTCIPNEQSKRLVRLFSYPTHVALGEAEAECAVLQRRGVVDAVMTQDVDAVMFGSSLTLRDWSREGTRGNKQPTHVNVLDLKKVKEISGLDEDGMVLVAILSGGDYNEAGLAGIGSGLACEIAKAGFGADLLEVVQKDDDLGVREWRERLQYELHTNESGYFKRKHKTIVIPEDFPDRTILNYYANPAVSEKTDMERLGKDWLNVWSGAIDVSELRRYVGETFDWLYRGGATKFVRSMAPPLLAQRLLRSSQDNILMSVDYIKERRQHFVNDGLPELRIIAKPAEVVGIDLTAEEDRPLEELEIAAEEDGEDPAEDGDLPSSQAEQPLDTLSQSPTKKRKSPPWDPYAPEKMWIPETIVQLGVPLLVEEWHQQQRELLADPKKFATRKCGKAKATQAKVKDIGMKEGAIRAFLKTSKPISLWQSPEPEQKEVPLDELPEMSDIFGLSQVTPRRSHETIQATKVKDPFENAIIIPSSPDPGPSLAMPTTPASQPVQTETGTTEMDIMSNLDQNALPDTVTQRRRRALRARATPESSPAKSPLSQKVGRQLKPIESFFIAAKARSKTQSQPPSAVTDPSHTTLPVEATTGLTTTFIDAKLAAKSRDSLPGTWEQVDEILISSSPTRSKKRVPRISYVDLAGD